jgi:hypothetical protein
MSKLWRPVSYLFWQYPKLWLPVTVAEVASYSVKRLQQIISHQIVLLVYHGGSVLSSPQDPVPGRSEVMKVAALAAPLLWGSYFVSILLYTCAMLATSRMLTQLVSSGMIELTVRSRIPDALKFSLKLLALCASCAILFAFPITSLALSIGSRDLSTNPAYIGAIVLMLTCAISFVMAPDALRIVSAHRNQIQPEQARSSRISACVANAAAIVLSLVVTRARIPLWNSWHNHEQIVLAAINLIGGVVVAVPYVPLFITLYLIANPDRGAGLLAGLQVEATGSTDIALSGDASQ